VALGGQQRRRLLHNGCGGERPRRGAARAGLIASSAAGLAAFALLFARLGVFRGDAGPNRLGEPNSGDREVEPVAEMFS
jgi:hypothetical protein